jgi:hypothetical protein
MNRKDNYKHILKCDKLQIRELKRLIELRLSPYEVAAEL